MMKRNYTRYTALLLFFKLLCFFSYSQVCQPTEKWINTGIPNLDFGASILLTMNENLYAIEHDFFTQEVSLFKYEGTSWSLMSSFSHGQKNHCAAVYKNQIYIGGTLDVAASSGVEQTSGLIRWDSTSNEWLSVDGGMGIVSDMVVYKDELYVTGFFNVVGSNNLPVKSIARWDGVAWDSVGDQQVITTIPPNDPALFNLNGLNVWQDKLVLTGPIDIQGNKHLVIWDGNVWTGFGVGSPDTELINLVVYKDELILPYVGSVGGQTFNGTAAWNGTNWFAYPTSIPALGVREKYKLKEYKGELFLAETPLGTGIGNIRKWDGSQWSTITGVIGAPHSFEVFQGELYMGGALRKSCNRGINDVVKLCADGENCQTISGIVFQDDNGNCQQDPGEVPLTQRWVWIQPGNYYIPVDASGAYSFLLENGSYTVNLDTIPTYYTNLCPPNGHQVNMTTNGMTGVDFALTPQPNIEDLHISLTGFKFRPGFTNRIYLDFVNKGTISQSGTVELELDSRLTYTGNSSNPVSSQNGNILSWNYTNLAASQSESIWIEASLAPTAVIGDTLYIPAEISPLANDQNLGDNFDTLKVVISGSFDPNDKQVVPAGNGANGEISLDTKILTYTVRFQNTGTDTAFTVEIRDAIDLRLDISSLQMLASSHPYTWGIDESGDVNWTFDNILLPDSSVNEARSHGFVKFSIHLKENLPVNTLIENEAFIYFDFNEPVITNTTQNTLVEKALSISPESILPNLKIWPQPAKGQVNFEWETPISGGEIFLFDLTGKQLLKVSQVNGRKFSLVTDNLPGGMYIFRIEQKGKLLGSGKLMLE